MDYHSRFATTRWSLVLAADGNAQALEHLCSLYWSPIFAFVRRQGYSSDDAQDLTQAFFARLLEKREIGNADPNRGRFRSFLLSACSHFLSNERDRVQTVKRGGRAIPVDIDEEALVSTETPERMYERQWALTLLQHVLGNLRDEYSSAGNVRVFDRLSEFVADPGGSYADAAADLGMSLSAVKMAIHRLRKRYRALLIERVTETVETPDDVEDEIRHLMNSVKA